MTKIAKLQPWSQQLQGKAVKALQDTFSRALPIVIGQERIRTGNMRRETTMTSSSTGARITASAGYSGYQNFGTRYMAGTHFMEAGVDAITSFIPSALSEIFVI